MGINLLKTKIKSNSNNANTGTYNTSNTMIDDSIHFNEGGVGEAEKKQVMVSLLIIIACVAGAYFFSLFAVGKVENSISKIIATNEKLNSEIEMKKNQIKDVEVFKEKSEEFSRKIEAIRILSKTRLVELKALDLIQSVTPDRLWFTKMKYENFNFTFWGEAVTRKDVDALENELKNSSFFSQVIPRLVNEKKDQRQNVWEFKLEALLRGEN